MKDLNLHYAPYRLLDKTIKDWDGMLVEDWGTLYAECDRADKLIELLADVLKKAIMVHSPISPSVCNVCNRSVGYTKHAEDCIVGLSLTAVDKWREAK